MTFIKKVFQSMLYAIAFLPLVFYTVVFTMDLRGEDGLGASTVAGLFAIISYPLWTALVYFMPKRFNKLIKISAIIVAALFLLTFIIFFMMIFTARSSMIYDFNQ